MKELGKVFFAGDDYLIKWWEAAHERTERDRTIWEQQEAAAPLIAAFERKFSERLAELEQERTPSERTRSKHYEQIKRFNTWCRQEGVCELPADGAVVAFYLVTELFAQGEDPRPAAKAIAWGHAVRGQYLDPAHLKVALEFCSGGDGGGKVIPLPFQQTRLRSRRRLQRRA
jgi:hypothetical protein